MYKNIEELLCRKANQVEYDIKMGVALNKATYTYAMEQYYCFLAPSLGIEACAQAQYAFTVRDNSIQKEIMESLILSEADMESIEDVFAIAPLTVEIYKELFFETDNLVSKLDVIGYLETYPDDMGRALKVRAYNLGPDFLYFRYGNITPSNNSQRALVKKIFLTSAYKAMEANYSGVGSANTKAATQHAGIMLKAYEAITKLMEDPDARGGEVLVKVLVGEDSKSEPTKAKKVPAKDII